MPEAEAAPRRRGRRILIAIGVLLALAAGVGGYWYLFMRGIVYSNDARLDADLVDLDPQFNSVLMEIRVREGDSIKQGQVLFALDRAPLAAALAKAEAAVISARASVAVAEAQYQKSINGPLSEEIRAAEAAEAQANAQARLAEVEWKRAQALDQSNILSQTDRDKARTQWESATLGHDQAVHRLELLRQGTRPEDLAAAKAGVELAKAQVAVAEAAVHEAQVNLAYTDVRAPFDGVVARRWLNVGDAAIVAKPVLTVLNPASLHVAANIEEKQLGRVTLGDEVDIAIDAYPKLALTGHVERILRATNSQFSLIPSEGVSGTYIKVTQRVPIRIALDTDPAVLLGPGLSVEVRIHVDHGAGPSAAGLPAGRQDRGTSDSHPASRTAPATHG